MDGADLARGSPAAPPPRHRVPLQRGPRLATLVLLGIVAAALIGAIVLMGRTVAAERSQRAQAARTNAVIIAVRDIMRTAVNGETGQRGYFITLDRRYLAPYLVARDQFRPNLARLRELTRDGLTARQRDLLDEIETLNEARFAELADTVELIGAGNLLEARRRVLTDEGQDLMERLRRASAQLEASELTAFDRASGRAEAAERRMIPLLAGLLMLILLALALGLMQVIRAADAEARAQGAAELARARDRADLLAHELNHRVKNLFAVILAIVRMSGRGQPEAAPVVDVIADRIHALLLAHQVTQGTSPQASGNLADLVEITLRPYRSEANRCLHDGPRIDLPERVVVPLGLVLHELATNAVKYGAWAHPGGTVAVQWRQSDGHLVLEWEETCHDSPGDPAQPPCEDAAAASRGFGTTLIEGTARQLGGSIERRFTARGAAVRIDLPLPA